MTSTVPAPEWHRALRWKLIAFLLVKLGMLSLLWALCFSSEHRPVVDAKGFGLAVHSEPETMRD